MDPNPSPESQLHSRLDAIATRWSLVREAHIAGTPQNATVARSDPRFGGVGPVAGRGQPDRAGREADLAVG